MSDTKEFYHPMRDAEIHVWERTNDNGNGSLFIARLFPYNVYPIFATGSTATEAEDKLEALRTEAYEKHEATFVARQKAAYMAREARKKKGKDND